MKKKNIEIPGSHHFSFFALSNLLTQTCFKFIIYYYICLTLCHILYFDAAKFSIKQFSLVYFTVSVVRQLDEYEIVTETRPIKTK